MTVPSSRSQAERSPTELATDPVDVSIVIPVLNGVPLLGEQLDALAAQNFDGRIEVIVADNGSSDGTPQFASEWADRLPLRVIDASSVAGVSHARNEGVRASRAPLVLLCDADDRVSTDWVQRMVAALATSDLVGGPRRIDRINEQLAASWRPPIPTDRLPVSLGYLPYAPGANTGFRASAFSQLDGYDETLVAGSDDTDFSWRAQLAGYRLSFADGAWIDYRLRPGLRSLYRQSRGYSRNWALLYRRYRDKGMPAHPTPWRSIAWWLLSRALLALTDPKRRGTWVRTLAILHGRVEGSIRHRVRF